MTHLVSAATAGRLSASPKGLLLAGFAVLCLSGAASWAMADDEMKCNPEGTQAEMNICAWDDFQKADDELNAVYKKAVAYTKKQDDSYADQPNLKGAVAALKKAQRAWIDYRDGHCEGIGFGARGGSMEPMLVAGCQEELTKKRIADLKSLMEEGDQ